MARTDAVRRGRGTAAQRREESRAAWRLVRELMRRCAGIVLEEEQEYLLEARLGSVARRSKLSPLGFVQRAQSQGPGSESFVALVEAFTTHETSFFRDQAFWTALEQKILPALLPRLGGRPLRVWSAACSTGQEPYTLAMLLEELDPALARRAEIVATDISQPTIERARAATYSPLEINRGLSAARAARHFEPSPGGLRVREALRRRVELRAFNLLGEEPYPGGFDLVLCRNVLIYFTESDRLRILRRLAAPTTCSGYLGIGCTERIGSNAGLAPGWFESRALEL